MYRWLMWVTAAALAAPAGASVQIFFTSAQYGLTDPDMAFVPTEGNRTDIADGHYHVGAFPPAMADATVGVGDTVYIWLKFNGEPNSRKVNMLNLDAAGATQAAWYIMDDTEGDVADKRWDGAYTLPGAPEFRVTHKILVAATSYGLKNLNAGNSGWLYSGNPYRTYLLGAVSYSAPGTYALADASFPTIICTYFVPPGFPYPPPVVELGSVTVTPEPASLALLAALGLLRVRRR